MAEYEAKVRTLIRHVYERNRQTAEGTSPWKEARHSLRGHDYYLLVMVKGAYSRSSTRDYLTLAITLHSRLPYICRDWHRGCDRGFSVGNVGSSVSGGSF
jgi:hypothetical protein